MFFQVKTTKITAINKMSNKNLSILLKNVSKKGGTNMEDDLKKEDD